MFDLMKRLAELDAKNPRVVKENKKLTEWETSNDEHEAEMIESWGPEIVEIFEKYFDTTLPMTPERLDKIADSISAEVDCPYHIVHAIIERHLDQEEHDRAGLAECGPMGMMGGMGSSNTPANISITAGSGEELSNMLTSIMKLAGVEKVTPDHLGSEPEPVALTATPVMGVGPAVGDRDDMRAVLDKMNDAGEEDGEEETDEGHDEFGISRVDNTPNRPDAHKPFSANAYAQNTNDGDGKDQAGHHRTGMQPTATYESLMAEYKKFVAEDGVQDYLDSGGKITQVKPQRGPKRPGLSFGSKHIGGPGGTGKRGSISGLGANTGKTAKPVVAVEDDDIAERMGDAIPIQVKFEDGTVKSERIVDGEPTSMMSRPELMQHFSEKYKKPVAGIMTSTQPISRQEPAPTAPSGSSLRDPDPIARAISRYDRQVPETVMDAQQSGRGVTINGKEVNLDSLEIDGVNSRDYPDFVDAYISYGLFTDGSELNDQEMDEFTDKYSDIVHQLAYDSFY